MIDFSLLDDGSLKLAELQLRYTPTDLVVAHHQSIDTILQLIEEATDDFLSFVPEDPLADDPAAETPEERYIPWTLGHVITHATATSEEAAANGASLARGIEVNWRNRYEVPWRSIQTMTDLRQRLEESRRIRIAYLNAWPRQPHLDILWTKQEQKYGALNAVGYTIMGLNHERKHFAQITDIMRQAQEALQPVQR